MILRWKPGALRRDTIIAALLVIAGIVLAIGLFLAGALWRRKTAAASMSGGYQNNLADYFERKGDLAGVWAKRGGRS